jgi:tetratricopeptide (TPR) repeat protein
MMKKGNYNVNNPAELQGSQFAKDSNGQNKTVRPLYSVLTLCLIFLVFYALAFALQHKGFNSAMVYDGAALIYNSADKFAEGDQVKIMRMVPIRPLFMLSIYYNYLVSGVEPYYFRMVNTIFVAAGGLALVLLCMIIFEIPGLRLPGTRLDKQGVSIFLGLLFVAHPLQTFVVLYEWQREASMAYFFYFATLAMYLAARSGRFRHTIPPYILTATLFLLGLLSKENLATVPVVLGLAELTLFRQNVRQLLKRALVVALITVPPIIAYIFATRYLYGPAGETSWEIFSRLAAYYKYSGQTPLQVVLTESRVLFSYLSMVLAPFFFTPEFMRAEIVSTSLLNPPATLVACAGVIALIGLSIGLLRKSPLIAFGILFYIIVLMPECLLIPQYLFFGYRAILPMAGILLAIGAMTLALVNWGRARLSAKAFRRAVALATILPVICMGAVTFSVARSWTALQFWRNPASQLPTISENVETVPYLDITLNYMANLLAAKNYSEAIEVFGKVSETTLQPEVSSPKPGAALYKSEHIDEAAAKFIEKFRGRPQRTSSGLLALGGALAQTGNVHQAVTAYRKAVQIDPYNKNARLNLAGFLAQTGNLQESVQHYVKAMQIDPKSAPAHYGLGLVQQRASRPEVAIQLYRKALELDGRSVMAYNLLGRALKDSGKLQEAMEQYRKAIEVDPKSADSHHNLGMALASSGNPPEAINEYRKAIELNPRLVVAYCNLGLALEYSGSFSEAIKVYTKAIEIDERSATAYNLLGGALRKSGNLKEAVKQFTKAVELDPNSADSHHNLGMVQANLGKGAEAIKEYREALEINPRLLAAHLNLGLALEHSGELDQAMAEYRTAIAIDPRSAMAYKFLGRTLAKSGNHSLALQYLKAATQLKPGSLDAEYRVAHSLLKNGELDEAIESFKRIVEKKPDFSAAQANLGVALLRDGQTHEAIEALQKAVALHKSNADIFYTLGLAFAKIGRTPEAVENLKTALALNPEHTKAQQYLDRLMNGTSQGGESDTVPPSSRAAN